MDDAELEANIAAVIKALCKHRNPALGKQTLCFKFLINLR